MPSTSTFSDPALCLASAIGSALICRFAIPLGERWRLMDHPTDRKLHKHSTPLMGGLVLALVVLPLSILFAMRLPGTLDMTGIRYASVALAITILGLADDRHTLSPRRRLVLSLVAFGLVATVDPLFNVRVLTFAYPEFQIGMGLGIIAVLFTAICSVSLINAVNMADGKNGLVIGLCLGWIAILSTRMPSEFLPLLLLLGTALAVMLPFNLRGKLFLGDGGAYGFASAIALLTVIAYNSPGDRFGRAITADEIILLFLVPILDASRLILVRSLNGQSPATPDRNHLHHHLQNWLGWPGGLIAYYLIALGPAAALFALG